MGIENNQTIIDLALDFADRVAEALPFTFRALDNGGGLLVWESNGFGIQVALDCEGNIQDASYYDQDFPEDSIDLVENTPVLTELHIQKYVR